MAKSADTKLIANNKKARHDYFLEETFEAGVELHGTEVKSLRQGHCSIKEAFIGKNCIIKNSIILNEVYIGDNTHIENCIVESRGTLKPNMYYFGDGEIQVVVGENNRYGV